MNDKPRAMRDALLEQIWQAMAHDDRIFFVTGDFGSPVLDKIRSDYPNRFRNVGVAEQNLINISAGLTLEGFRVFAYAIAPFITMRCYEQLRISVALLSECRPMNINLIGVGAGYSYVVSGPTHQCYEDLTLMRALVNFRILSPGDHITSAALLPLCLAQARPKYIRLDAQILPTLYNDTPPDLKKGFTQLAQGRDLCLIGTGYTVHSCLKLSERLKTQGIHAAVLDLIDIQDFDEDHFVNTVRQSKMTVSIEEGFQSCGGLDARLNDVLGATGLPYLGIGVAPGYRFELGRREELHERAGMGVETAFSRICDFYNRVSAQKVTP